MRDFPVTMSFWARAIPSATKMAFVKDIFSHKFANRYYSQSFHSHAQKQSAKPSADASHLDFLLMWVK